MPNLIRSLAVALVLSGAAALRAAPARAGDSPHVAKELKELLASLEGAEDSAEKRRLIRELAGVPSIRAAERLRRIVRTDPDPAIRVEAAEALGRSPVPESLDFLLELALEGGPSGVRRAIGRAAARRHGAGRIAAALEKTDDALGRGLLIETLVEDTSPESVDALLKLARGGDPFLRVEALRALARNQASRPKVPALLREVLTNHHDVSTILAGLDVGESLADAEFRELADLFATFLEPEVQDAVAAVRRRVEYLDRLAAARKTAKDRYSWTEEVPEPPVPRPRIDIVYVFDATGSTCGHIGLIRERVRRESLTLTSIGSDLRVGFVAYRDTGVRRDQWLTNTFPLTHDLTAAHKWLDGVQAGGCDAQGAAVTEGLQEALGRMAWRWTATRQVGLVADSRTGEPERSRALVKLHYQADHTRLRVWYLYRTRVRIPPDIEALARVCGGSVESLE